MWNNRVRGGQKSVYDTPQRLKKLEYRGYDSAGIAIKHTTSQIEVRKRAGKIEEIERHLNSESIEGNIGIAHTRWATHGAVTDENAHPHTDCEGKIAIVHNGIIENYKELKERLISKGHSEVSNSALNRGKFRIRILFSRIAKVHVNSVLAHNIPHMMI